MQIQPISASKTSRVVAVLGAIARLNAGRLLALARAESSTCRKPSSDCAARSQVLRSWPTGISSPLREESSSAWAISSKLRVSRVRAGFAAPLKSVGLSTALIWLSVSSACAARSLSSSRASRRPVESRLTHVNTPASKSARAASCRRSAFAWCEIAISSRSLRSLAGTEAFINNVPE